VTPMQVCECIGEEWKSPFQLSLLEVCLPRGVLGLWLATFLRVARGVDLARIRPRVKRAKSDWRATVTLGCPRAKSDWRATVTLGCPRAKSDWRATVTLGCPNFARDIRHTLDSLRMRGSHPRIRRKCCAHLPREERATRDVTFEPLCRPREKNALFACQNKLKPTLKYNVYNIHSLEVY
jgi:hypothetical protein